MIDESAPSIRLQKRPLLIPIFFLLGIAVVATGLAAGLGWLDGFVAFATFGTALGTLGLAFYTFRLAESTRQSVEGADRLADLAFSQLKEVKAQRDLIAEQAKKAGEQAEAAQRLADSSSISAAAASKARIDARAPLIDLRVELLHTQVSDMPRTKSQLLKAEDRWYEAQLRDCVFEVVLGFTFKNVGGTPAQVTFGGSASNLDRVAQDGIHMLVLEPDEKYEDRLRIPFVGEDAKVGKNIIIPVTYNGLIHGEMFDHLQWSGWITPLKLSEGVAQPNDTRWILNASGAQVNRSYPNFERPQEMGEVRERIFGSA